MDGHGDVTALLDLSTNSTAVQYEYDAFGVVTKNTNTSIDNPILYSGYQYDKETELYYLNARMYDPEIARFMQMDTYLGQTKDPLSLNLYTYCFNNPISYYDPSGNIVTEWDKAHLSDDEIDKIDYYTEMWEYANERGYDTLKRTMHEQAEKLRNSKRDDNEIGSLSDDGYTYSVNFSDGSASLNSYDSFEVVTKPKKYKPTLRITDGEAIKEEHKEKLELTKKSDEISDSDFEYYKEVKSIVWNHFFDNGGRDTTMNYYDDSLADYTVTQDLFTISPYTRKGTSIGDIKAVVMHWVANAGTSAQANRDWMEGLKVGVKIYKDTNNKYHNVYPGQTVPNGWTWTGNYKKASVHYFVGLNGEVIQSIPDNEVAMHTGNVKTNIAKSMFTSGFANPHTLGIETSHTDSNGNYTNETYTSMVRLTADLLDTHGLDASTGLLRHNDISKKDCPKLFTDYGYGTHDPSNLEWMIFKTDVIEAMMR